MMEGMDTLMFAETDVTSGVLVYQAFHEHRSGWGGRPGDETTCWKYCKLGHTNLKEKNMVHGWPQHG